VLSSTWHPESTVSAGSWTITGAATAHEAVASSDEDTSYVRSIGTFSGTLKLGIPAAAVGTYRLRNIKLNPFQFRGNSAANYPVLKVEIVFNGNVIAYRQYDVDSANDWVIGNITISGLNISGYLWNSGSRQLWLTVKATSTSEREDTPIPIDG